MSRAVWSGALSVGLLHVPVSTHVSARSSKQSFRTLEASTLQPIKQQRVSSVTGEVVTEFVKGVEHGEEFLEVEDTKLDALAPLKSRTIELAGFVKSIPMSCITGSHQLAPGKGGEKGFELLVQALTLAEARFGIGTYVTRGQERLVAIYAERGTLYMSELSWHDEIAEIVFERFLNTTDREREMAIALIENMEIPFSHDEFVNEHRGAVAEYVQSLRDGTEMALPELVYEQAPSDLMAQLEASIAAAREKKDAA